MRTRSRSHRHVTFRLACRCTPLRFFSARVRLVFVPGLPRRRETRRQTSRTRPTPRLFVLCHLGLVFQEQHPVAVQFVWSSTTAFPSAHGTTCGHHRCCCNRGRPTDLKPLSGVRFRTRANEVRSPLWPKRIASCTRGAARSRLYAALARDGCFCCGTHDSLLVRATITEPRRPKPKGITACDHPIIDTSVVPSNQRGQRLGVFPRELGRPQRNDANNQWFWAPNYVRNT